MKAVLQRAKEARVTVEGRPVGKIDRGLVVLLGVVAGDGEREAEALAKKCCELRIFADDDGRMNRSLLDVDGELLVVSQFTLAADCRKGRRPSFTGAADPEAARSLYEHFCEACRLRGVHVATGEFAAFMQVRLTNDGPVTILLDTQELGG